MLEYKDESQKNVVIYMYRDPEKPEHWYQIEKQLEFFCVSNKLHVLKKFSDLGDKNLNLPGLTSLWKELINRENLVDMVIIYVPNSTDIEVRRTTYILKRLRRYITEVILFSSPDNWTGESVSYILKNHNKFHLKSIQKDIQRPS
ncbi:hypothetical protein D8M04_09615 [Oceanobacillus piezotolerans]|uniref:Resolvase/invertase-type recombinase catalytic domain-containing protein n=1 Tax=Oceanobacillus piezotolerans TaxID=2448030 RepID=A0A498DHY6_9BACI|nr:hypothetical protein [Oceanobacillus piezotolerans]RLL45115.1 hypothetical protein D8M04_09615 [Oceanobacillus piezotolerans]